MPAKLISDAARDLIVAEEVSSEATYEKRYTHPEWPGGQSGVTIGIGYDIGAGVKNRNQLWADWKGHIPDAMISALEPCIGVTGDRARALLPSVRNRVIVPWDSAIAVFDQVDVPRWADIVRHHLPNCDQLSPDCFGALLSLAYNRGPSFESSGDRYREMRAIKEHMAARRFDRIPAEFRAMARLWPNLPGLQKRREHEAILFERGLKVAPARPVEPLKPIPPIAKPTPTPVPRPVGKNTAAGTIAGGGAVIASTAKAGGASWAQVGGFMLGAVVLAVVVWLILHHRGKKK